MSESVKIGGVGKNPTIDKINNLNSIDVKNYAVNKMEQLLLSADSSEKREYTKTVRIDFNKADWKGELKDVRQERTRMEGSKVLRTTDMYTNSDRLDSTIRRGSGQKISIQNEATGDIHQFGGKQDTDVQFVGKAVARETGLFSDIGNAKNNQSHLSGERSGTGKEISNQGRADRMVLLHHRRDKW